jgi:hypothetical protein
MSDQRFKTFRHIETVRNYLNQVIRELLHRQEQHDQSKFSPEESSRFNELTDKLRDITFGSPEYYDRLKSLGPALEHHYSHNRHHPQFHKTGILGMNLIDITEMLVDWKASSMRHNDGDIYKSIEINQKRFGFSDELKQLLINTAVWLEDQDVYHKAKES